MRESDVKFFRPLWLRILLTGICAVWFGIEAVYTHDQMWLAITGVAVVYCVWNFFLKFPKDAPLTAAAPPAPDDPAPPGPTQP